MLHRSEVADKEKRFFRLVRLSLEDHDILVVVCAVDPLEAFRLVIHLVKRRLYAV